MDTRPYRIKRTSRVVDVLQRAMARPLRRRFHPLVVCDDRDTYIGIVRIERLVERVTAARLAKATATRVAMVVQSSLDHRRTVWDRRAT